MGGKLGPDILHETPARVLPRKEAEAVEERLARIVGREFVMHFGDNKRTTKRQF